MDWRRAKSILIITFLLLNFFLASQVYDTVGEQSKYLSNNKISDEQIENLLRVNQIQLAKNVKPKNIEEAIILKGNLEVLPGKSLGQNYYEKEIPIPSGLNLDIPKISDLIALFFSGNIQYAFQQGDTFVFYQTIRGLPIYTNPISATVANGKLRIKASYFRMTETGEPIQIIPVNNALNILINSDPQFFQKKEIQEIKLGYQLVSYDPAYLIPVWRFKVGDHHYLVPAHKTNTNMGVITETISTSLVGEKHER